MRSLYRVPEGAPPHVNGHRVQPGDILSLTEAEACYERDLGHVEATTVEGEARPLVGLTDEERAALPVLAPLGDGQVEYANGEGLRSEGTGEAMTAVFAEPDGAGGFVGQLEAE